LKFCTVGVEAIHSPIIIVRVTTWHGKSVDVVREITAEKEWYSFPGKVI